MRRVSGSGSSFFSFPALTQPEGVVTGTAAWPEDFNYRPPQKSVPAENKLNGLDFADPVKAPRRTSMVDFTAWRERVGSWVSVSLDDPPSMSELKEPVSSGSKFKYCLYLIFILPWVKIGQFLSFLCCGCGCFKRREDEEDDDGQVPKEIPSFNEVPEVTVVGSPRMLATESLPMSATNENFLANIVV